MPKIVIWAAAVYALYGTVLVSGISASEVPWPPIPSQEPDWNPISHFNVFPMSAVKGLTDQSINGTGGNPLVFDATGDTYTRKIALL